MVLTGPQVLEFQQVLEVPENHRRNLMQRRLCRLWWYVWAFHTHAFSLSSFAAFLTWSTRLSLYRHFHFANKLRPSEHIYISPLDHILRVAVQKSTLSPSSPGGPGGPAGPGSPTCPGCPSGPAGPASPFSPCRTNGDKYKCLVNSNISCSSGESYSCIRIDYSIFLSSLSWALLSVS